LEFIKKENPDAMITRNGVKVFKPAYLLAQEKIEYDERKAWRML